MGTFYVTSGVSRRSLLAGGASLLAATAIARRGSAAPTSDSVANASGEIKVLGYQFYQVDDVHNAGKVKASWSYVNGDTEIPPKLRAGGFDVTTLSLPVRDPVFGMDRLAEIDTSLLKNYAALDATLRDLYTRDGKVYGVPYAVVPGQMAWNSSRVPEPKTMQDLLKPDYQGVIALVDNPINLCAYALGLGLNTAGRPELVTHEQMKQVLAFLEQLKPQVKTVYSFGDEPNLFARGDIALAYNSFASFFTDKPEMKFNFVGSISYLDGWSVLNDGNADAALAWIDNYVSVEGLSAMAGNSFANPSNDAALGGLPESLRLPVADLIKQSPPLGSVPLAKGDHVSLPEMIDLWSAYKSSFL